MWSSYLSVGYNCRRAIQYGDRVLILRIILEKHGE